MAGLLCSTSVPLWCSDSASTFSHLFVKPTARDPQLSPSSQNGVTVPDLAKADDWPTQNERPLPLVDTRSPVSPVPDWLRESDSWEAFHSSGPYSRPNTRGSWPKVSNKCTVELLTHKGNQYFISNYMYA